MSDDKTELGPLRAGGGRTFLKTKVISRAILGAAKKKKRQYLQRIYRRPPLGPADGDKLELMRVVSSTPTASPPIPIKENTRDTRRFEWLSSAKR